MRVLDLSPFPGCCKALVLHNFGSCNHNNAVLNEDEVRADVREAIELCRRNGNAFLTAILSDQQEYAHRILREEGFGRCRKWAEKGGPNAGNTRMKIYYYYLQPQRG